MSLVADAYLLPRDRLQHVVDAARPKRRFLRPAADDFDEVLEEASREVDRSYEWSGIHLVNALVYLEERGVPLLRSEEETAMELSQARAASAVILTSADRGYLHALDPASHDEGALRQWAEAFSELDDPDAGRAMKGALALLHTRLGTVDDDSVLLLLIR